MKANNNDMPIVLQIIQDADLDKLIDFVNNGGDVFVQDADGNDAMYYAAKAGNEEIVAMLEMLAEGMGKSFFTSLKSTESKTRPAKRRVQGDAGECTATVDEIWDELLPKSTTRKEIEKYVLALKKQDFLFNANLDKISACFYEMEEGMGLKLVDVIWDNYEFDMSEFLHWQLRDYVITNDDNKRYKLLELIVFSVKRDHGLITRGAHCTQGLGSLAHRIIDKFPELEALTIFQRLDCTWLMFVYCCNMTDIQSRTWSFLDYAIIEQTPKIVRYCLANSFVHVASEFYKACACLTTEIEKYDNKRRSSILWPINKLWDGGYIPEKLLEIYAYMEEAKRQVKVYGEVRYPEKLVYNKYGSYKWDKEL